MRPAIRETLDELEAQRQAEMAGGGMRGGNRDQSMLAVGPEAGQFLNALIRATRAERVIEVGGSMGYSTIWQAEAVEANAGRMTTLEIVPEKIATLRRRIAQAGLESTVEVREGDALAALAELEGPFDFVLIDAWKDDYPAYFDLVFPKLRAGGLMVADNMINPPPSGGIEAYAERARTNPNARTQTLKIGNGLELTLKLG